MGRRGGHDQGVGLPGEQLGEFGAQRPTAAADRHVVRLIDHDDVPAAVFEMDAVVGAGLQRVDGDDGAIVVMERIGIGGNAGADAVDAEGIKAHQRNSEPRPHFLLELGHHALHRDDQDALPAPPLDEFAQQDADFDRLSQAG